MTACASGGLSMRGGPPTAGFLGKWYMLMGAMNTGEWVAVAVIVLSTLLNAGYYLPIIFRAFFKPPGKDVKGKAKGEAPMPIVRALTATAAATVVMFRFPEIPITLARLLAGV